MKSRATQGRTHHRATSGATPLNTRAISAAPMAGQRATIARPTHVQGPPIAQQASACVGHRPERKRPSTGRDVRLASRPAARDDASENLGFDTTVGEPWRIRIAPPGLTRSARTDSPRQVGRNNFRRTAAAVATSGDGGGFE
ncbi:protein phosphatase 2C and cyclic nucleotide-binding/kinase domain-containing protein [Dorcoceras hygrometricum]|uniref:Protein phosphatase 2C and cyclic nucleotide-binding/kinase domain-containing protein n=1 Tax=Dorcoceras hygrometricum TaxID=472368 RepID=A0A2Z7C7J8_9LAMI|nr:protein phosphatase 2C and cyclic nucleotide-binding/kinase domain-containing protein [Dorcoceras hygrometricum]